MAERLRIEGMVEAQTDEWTTLEDAATKVLSHWQLERRDESTKEQREEVRKVAARAALVLLGRVRQRRISDKYPLPAVGWLQEVMGSYGISEEKVENVARKIAVGEMSVPWEVTDLLCQEGNELKEKGLRMTTIVDERPRCDNPYFEGDYMVLMADVLSRPVQ